MEVRDEVISHRQWRQLSAQEMVRRVVGAGGRVTVTVDGAPTFQVSVLAEVSVSKEKMPEDAAADF